MAIRRAAAKALSAAERGKGEVKPAGKGGERTVKGAATRSSGKSS